MINFIAGNEEFQEKYFYRCEVSFYIDDHINCHKCPILKAEQQN
jgi:hypothetical protein